MHEDVIIFYMFSLHVVLLFVKMYFAYFLINLIVLSATPKKTNYMFIFKPLELSLLAFNLSFIANAQNKFPATKKQLFRVHGVLRLHMALGKTLFRVHGVIFLRTIKPRTLQIYIKKPRVQIHKTNLNVEVIRRVACIIYEHKRHNMCTLYTFYANL